MQIQIAAKDFSVERLGNWQKFGHRVLCCLSRRNDWELCSLNFSPFIILGEHDN